MRTSNIEKYKNGFLTASGSKVERSPFFRFIPDLARLAFDVRLLFFLLLPLNACAPDPFTRPPLPPLKNPSLDSARHFPALLPDQFTSDDTVILQAPFNHNFAILGVLTVNRPAHRFELAGLNQLGVVFFQIGGDSKAVHITQAIPPLMEHRQILLSMAHDIQRIYLDLAPPAFSSTRITDTQIAFTGKTPEGKMTCSFGYEPSLLLEKQVAGCFGAAWRVRYYDYQPGDQNKLFPRSIVMDNYQYHYRIIIKNRDWSPPDPGN